MQKENSTEECSSVITETEVLREPQIRGTSVFPMLALILIFVTNTQYQTEIHDSKSPDTISQVNQI
jgi:hypothetical protein